MSLSQRRANLNRELRPKPIRFPYEIHFDNWKLKISSNEQNNIVTIQTGEDYEVRYLRGHIAGNKGSHYVVKLVSPDDEYEQAPLIMKICSYDNNDNGNKNILNLFKREVKALLKAKQKGSQRVISIFEEGDVNIRGRIYQYYIMEYADSDLCNYLYNNEVSIQQKILICHDLLNGLKELHDINIYHRDIKHDNLLMCNTQCKLGDLGLMKYRYEDTLEFRSRLGAYGWESPEAINKYYTEREVDKDSYQPEDDCKVDDKSDVFQLGKVFWYVFTGKIPIGQLEDSDLNHLGEAKEDVLDIFNVIKMMLLQDKQRRADLSQARIMFNPIVKKFSVI